MINIGYHVHPVLRDNQPYSAADKARMWAHFEKVQPSALLFLNNVDDAFAAKARFPSCAVVHRTHYHNEGGLWKEMTPQQFYDRHAGEGANGVIVNVLNEPSGYVTADEHKRMASWCAGVMDLFGNAGIQVVTPNWGVGHPQENRYEDFGALWDAFDRWQHLHYLGAHEYWSYKGIEAGNGRVGRFLWMVAWLRQQGKPFPRLLFTEWGLDDLLDGSGKRGWRDSRTEKAYAAECLEAARRYYDFSYVKGVCLFSWGNSGRSGAAEDWFTHDVCNALEYQQMIETAAPVTAPARKYEPGEYIMEGDTPFNVRPSPSTSGIPIGKLNPGDTVRTLDVDAAQSIVDNRILIWQQVDITPKAAPNLTLSGWVAVTDLELTLKVTEPTPPPPTLPPITVLTRAELLLLAESHEKIAAMFRAAAGRLAA